MVISYFWRLALIQLAAIIAEAYGLFYIIPRTRGLYFRMPIMALVCLMMGNFPYIALYFAISKSNTLFSIGVLGNIGCVLFMLTQNIGSITNMFYDTKHVPSRNKRISLILTLIFLGISLFAIFFSFKSYYDVNQIVLTLQSLSATLIVILVSATLYKLFIFLMIKDEQDGFVSCLKSYNIVLTIFLILTVLENSLRHIITASIPVNLFIDAVYIGYVFAIIILLPVLERGRVKFLTSL